MNDRIVLLGLDGVPYELIERFTRSGVMPCLADLVARGEFRRMLSSIPAVSSVAWSSIITGHNPGEHGIYGFTDLAPGSYRLFFPNFRDLKAPAFWHTDPNRRFVVINVPFTYPAQALKGVHIAGFVAPELENAVYPPSLLELLQELDYRVDVDTTLAHNYMRRFLRELDCAFENRVAVYRHLWTETDWDTFMLVFTGTDRLSHFLWRAYDDPAHPFHEGCLRHFRQVDAVIGEIAERLGPRDVLMILSDHGFEALDLTIHLNALLKEEGYLQLRRTPAKSYNDLDSGTVAFALDPGRVYIHRRDRYPRGSVPAAEVAATVDELQDFFSGLQVNGKGVIDTVYRKEAIYRGPHRDRAPDLVLMPAPGVDLRARIRSTQIVGEEPFTGKHSQHNAFLLVVAHASCLAAVPPEPWVFDLVPLLAELGTTREENCGHYT